MIRSRILCAALLLLAMPAVRADDRSTEVLRYDCVTELARREMTLFANGTIRLRKGQIGNEWMGLASCRRTRCRLSSTVSPGRISRM